MESKTRSCCTREKMCGVRVEKACYVFSIINVVFVSACLAGCLIYIAWLCDIHFYPNRHEHINGLAMYLNVILCIILSLCTAVAFSFSVLLCYGVHKKIPSFLMTYWCYGIFVEVVSVAGAIASIVAACDETGVDKDQVIVSSAALAACVSYVFPLILVRQTYVKFVNATTNAANTSLLQGI